MRKLFFAILIGLASIGSFAQNRDNEKVNIKYIQLPIRPLVGVQTYNCQLDATGLLAVQPEVAYQYGVNENVIKGYFALQGLSYVNENADATITLVANDVTIESHKIVNIANSVSSPNFKIIFSVNADWKVKVWGKVTEEFSVNEVDGKIEVRFPADENKFGMPTENVATKEALEKHYLANGPAVDAFVIENAIKGSIKRAGSKVQSNYAFRPVQKKIEICSFKNNKKYDATQWEKFTPIAIEAINGLTIGQSPAATYAKAKDAIDFWASQFEANKGDLKANDKVIEAVTKNLITFLTLTNPSLIKDEYYTALKSVAFFDAEEMVKWSDTLKGRLEANTEAINFTSLGAEAALNGYQYEVAITTKGGEKIEGIITFDSPYYLNPYELSVGAFKVYKTSEVIAGNTLFSSKTEVEIKTIASYSLLGKFFELVKFSDPTVVSLSGNEEYMECISRGAASLYKKFSVSVDNGTSMVIGGGSANLSETDLENSRKNPGFVVLKGKKASVVFNYSRLTETLGDCPAVADKIKSGVYGNPQFEAKTSKFGSFIQKGLVNSMDEVIVMKIFTDYNSQMKL